MNKKLLASVCAFALGISCLSVSAFADTQAELTSFEPTSDNVKQIGRTYYNGESLWFSHSASGIEFTFTGTTAEITITGDGNAVGSENGARIVIFADGERVLDEMQTETTQVHTVTLDEGTHTIKVLKASESANGSILIDSIAVDSDNIAPTESKTHSIEFIGDSITCGYGVDGTTGSFSTKTEDGTKTYAYKAAQIFDADYSMVSVSGSGVVSGYTNGSNANTQNLMPNFYELLGHSWGWIDGKNIDQVEWDFDSYTPDLIVINLGTNDASYTKGDATKIEEFKTAYIAFLKQVRDNNPDSEILCTLGVMGQDLYTAIEEAAETYKTETGDTKVNTFEFSIQDTTANGVGIDWHPSDKSHTVAASELAKEINKLYGWQIADTTYNIVEDTSSEDPEDTSSESEAETSTSDVDSSIADTDSSVADNSAESKITATSSKASDDSTSSSDNNPSTGLQALGAAIAIIGLAGIAVARKEK